MDALLKKLEDCEAMGMEVGRIEVSEAQAVEMDLAWKRDQAARDARKLSETVAMENLLDAIRKEGW